MIEQALLLIEVTPGRFKLVCGIAVGILYQGIKPAFGGSLVLKRILTLASPELHCVLQIGKLGFGILDFL